MNERYNAPKADGAVLAVPPLAHLPKMLEGNVHKLHGIDRTAAIREALNEARLYHAELGEPVPDFDSERLMVSGHQPEVFHPGVWIKNFALHSIAKKTSRTPLNLIVDTDLVKSDSLRVPVRMGPSCYAVWKPEFDAGSVGGIYEGRGIEWPKTFLDFPERVEDSFQPDWKPLLHRYWPKRVEHGLADTLTGMRRRAERDAGVHNLELPISRLTRTESFRRFASVVIDDTPRFAGIYNQAVRDYRVKYKLKSLNHPVPELAEGETPFWKVDPATGRRGPFFLHDDWKADLALLRPRALMTTLYARVYLGDGFLHGIGGGKYDEVTDSIIRDWLGIEPPAYGVLSMTARLPLPFERMADDSFDVEWRRHRDLEWNPQRFLKDAPLVEAKRKLVEAEPQGREERRKWFRDLQAITAAMRERLGIEIAESDRRLTAIRRYDEMRKIVDGREYAWVLFPESLPERLKQAVS